MSQGKLKEAISDFDMGIDISNENKLVKEKQELLSLRTEAVRKMNEVYGGFETIHGDKASANTTSTAETKKNKMVIEEIDDSEDEEEEKEAQHPITRTKKIAIEEIEDDDDEEEMEEDEQYEKEGNGNAYVPLGFSSRLSGPVITEIIEEETEPSLTPSCTIKVPAAAKTSYEFEAVWKSRRRSNRLIEEWVPYLTQFEPVVLAKLCAGTGGGSGDADLLEDLFLVLANLLNGN